MEITRLTDSDNHELDFTPFGEMKVVQPVRLVGSQFDGPTLDTNFWTSTTASAGDVTQSGSEVTLSAGTNSGGSARLNSVRRGRYISHNSNWYRAVVQLSDAGLANNIKQWGVAYGTTMPTVTDGAYFETSGTIFSCVTLKAGVATKVASGSWNSLGKMSGNAYTLDTNAHAYEIIYTNSEVIFSIDDVVCHTTKIATAVNTWTSTMHLHCYLANTNTGNTTNTSLKCRIASISRMGSYNSAPSYKYQSGTTSALICKYEPGVINSIVISNVTGTSAVTLYDNTAASGTKIWESGAMGANTIPVIIDFSQGIPFQNGLTLVIATAACNVLIEYE